MGLSKGVQGAGWGEVGMKAHAEPLERWVSIELAHAEHMERCVSLAKGIASGLIAHRRLVKCGRGERTQNMRRDGLDSMMRF